MANSSQNRYDKYDDDSYSDSYSSDSVETQERDDQYNEDSTYDAPHGTGALEQIDNSERTCERRDERKKIQELTFTILAGLAILAVVLVIMLIIGTAANRPDTPEDESGTIAKDKISWGSVTVSADDVKRGSLVLSNDTHSYSITDDDSSLAKIYDFRASRHSDKMPYQLSGLSQYMNGEALAALDSFLTDCAAATGNSDVLLRTAYLTAAEMSKVSLKEHALDYTTGYGCDLRLSGNNVTQSLTTNEAVNSWLTANAAKYGFVVRYPSDKAEVTGVVEYTNYFRYVGVPHATYMSANGLCLEEYLQQLKQYTSKDRLTVTGTDGRVYEIYYCAVSGNTSVSCPTNYAYTITGTNDGGVVVTIDRSAALDNTSSSSADTTPSPSESSTDTTSDTTAAGS